MIIGEVEAVDRKQKIRDRYKGVDISELEVIPAKIIENLETSSVIRRVAAYKCNVIGKEEQWHEQKTEGISRVSLPLTQSAAGGWASISGFQRKI